LTPGGGPYSAAHRSSGIDCSRLCERERPDGRQAASTFAAPASTRQIAEALVVSPETVKSHLSALFEAFGVRTTAQNQRRAELTRRALELGVVARAELER
jgi:DNA-binding CsgD family transcriptional regulator